jgi:hypothetical protein
LTCFAEGKTEDSTTKNGKVGGGVFTQRRKGRKVSDEDGKKIYMDGPLLRWKLCRARRIDRMKKEFSRKGAKVAKLKSAERV